MATSITLDANGNPVFEDVVLEPETKVVAAMIGNITFQELFTTPWKTLAARLRTNATTAIAKGDIPATDTPVPAIDSVPAGNASLNLRDIYENEAVQQIGGYGTTRPTWPPLLTRLGFPRPNSVQEVASVLAAFDGLVVGAGTCTFESIYESSDVDGDPEKTRRARAALREARRNRLLFMPMNGKCCSCPAGGGACHCTTGQPLDFCSIVNNACTLSSTSCQEV